MAKEEDHTTSVTTPDRKSAHKKPILQGVTGVILAGGRSTRYGRNKAFVEMDGLPLIERVVEVMDTIFHRLVLITNTPHEYAHLQLPMHEDLIKDLGPIGGIYTGLSAIQDKAAFFVACDMPFLNEALIRHIVSLREDYDAVVPRVDWKIEALHTLYNKSCLPIIRERIDARKLQIIKFFKKIRIRYIEEEEIRVFDPQLKTFVNINRPEDLSAIS